VRTRDAARTSGRVDLRLDAYPVLPAPSCPWVGSVVVMRKMFRNNPVEHQNEDRDTEKGGDHKCVAPEHISP